MGNYLSYGTLTTPAATDVLLACTPTNAEVMQTPRSSLLQTLEAGTTTLTGVGTIVLGSGGTLTGSSGGTSSVGTATLTFPSSGGGTVTLGDPINGVSMIGRSSYNRPVVSDMTLLNTTATGTYGALGSLQDYLTAGSPTGPIVISGSDNDTTYRGAAVAHGQSGGTFSVNGQITVTIPAVTASGAFPEAGIMLYESSSDKAIIGTLLGPGATSGTLFIGEFTNFSNPLTQTLGTYYQTAATLWYPTADGGPTWLHMKYVDGSVSLSWSKDGLAECGSGMGSIASFFTGVPDMMGFVRLQGNVFGYTFGMSVWQLFGSTP